MSELREREFGRDFFQESGPAGRRRQVHLVMGEIGRARQRVADRPQRPADRLARRIAHQEGAPARAAIAGHRDEPANIVQSRLCLAIDHPERDAGQEDPVEEALEDRGIAEIDFKKNRHGPTGCVRVAWRPQTMRFYDLAEQY